jgi:hypothetical protein
MKGSLCFSQDALAGTIAWREHGCTTDERWSGVAVRGKHRVSWGAANAGRPMGNAGRCRRFVSLGGSGLP